MGRSASMRIVLTSLDSGKQQSIWQLCDGLRCKVTVNLVSTRLLLNALQGRRCSRVNTAEDVRVVSRQAAAALAAFLLTRKRPAALWGAEIAFWMCFLEIEQRFSKRRETCSSSRNGDSASFLLYFRPQQLSFHDHCKHVLAPVWIQCSRLWRTLTIVLLWKLPKVCGVVLILVADNVPVRLVGLDALRRQREQLSSL